MNCAGASLYNFQTLKVSSPREYVKHVQLNRPEKRNAMNPVFWREMTECFTQLSEDQDCRVIVLSGAGKLFSSGIDLNDRAVPKISDTQDVARKSFVLLRVIKKLQDSMTAIEQCPKPVIVAVHNACIGAGVDLISACDIRFCTYDAWFQIKEIDLGLAADLGTLQRFPKIVGNDSLARELVYTTRKFSSEEAKSIGLISQVFPDTDILLKHAMDTASLIASKSPVAVQGSKVNLVYSRDHSVQESLDYINTWNLAMLQSEDVSIAATALMSKTKPVFSKL